MNVTSQFGDEALGLAGDLTNGSVHDTSAFIGSGFRGVVGAGSILNYGTIGAPSQTSRYVTGYEVTISPVA